MPNNLVIILCVAMLLSACGQQPQVPAGPGADAQGFTAPTSETTRANNAVQQALDLDDRAAFKAARRGLIATPDNLTVPVMGKDEALAWNRPAYDFIQGPAPASVNPSLWRHAKLNNIHGLFKVTDRVYQLRGFDLANMTLIAGDTGWIVVDPLTTAETARAAFNFAQKTLGEPPIKAVLFTHSHVDHFGGINGILTTKQAAVADVRVIAPTHFVAEATSENLLAGPAMGRRSAYMFGSALPRDARGHVDSGLGKAPARGHVGILLPTETIDHTGQTLTIDGVKFVFQLVSGSEAPAEFTFYLPQFKAWCAADLVAHTLENLYTLRGAKVRDALQWSHYIDQAITLFGHQVQVAFGSHTWPVWGQENIVHYLEVQRDTYKYIHDQTLRLANNGYTPTEIAARITLPDSLRQGFANRDYYGTVIQNSRAVYQFYFGWYDGNPAHLNPLPPVPASRHYVAYMGGAEKLLAKARQSFDAGEYRWVAEVLNHLIMAQPDNVDARALLARTYDQLGYQTESGPWRDEYLTAAYELRHGPQGSAINKAHMSNFLAHVPIARLFDAMAVHLNGPEAAGRKLTINFQFTDLQQNYVVTIKNGVLHHHREAPDPHADTTVHLTRDFLLRLLTKQAGLKEMIFSDQFNVDGSRIKLLRFFSLMQNPRPDFAIVLP